MHCHPEDLQRISNKEMASAVHYVRIMSYVFSFYCAFFSLCYDFECMHMYRVKPLQATQQKEKALLAGFMLSLNQHGQGEWRQVLDLRQHEIFDTSSAVIIYNEIIKCVYSLILPLRVLSNASISEQDRYPASGEAFPQCPERRESSRGKRSSWSF